MMHARFPIVTTIAIATMSLVGPSACRQEEVPPPAAPTLEQPTPPSTAPDKTDESHKTARPVETAATPESVEPAKAAPTTETATPDEEFPAKAAMKRRIAIEEAQARLLAKWAEINAVSVIYKSEYERKEGLKQEGETHSRYDILKREGAMLMRYLLVNRMIAERDEDDKVLTGENKLMVYDGEFLYSLQTLHDKQLAYKRYFNPNRFQQIAGPLMFTQLRSFESVERQRPQKINGRDVEVFAFSNNDNKVHGKSYVDVETGILAKFELTSETIQQTLTATMLELNLDPEFPDDHFTFVVPDGVELIDETKPPPAGTEPKTTETGPNGP